VLHETRISYKTLKSWAFECYYEGCRDHALGGKWSHDEVMGYVSCQFESVFERAVEQFMWRVILMILSAGWNPDFEKSCRQWILDQMEKSGLDNLLCDVPEEEVALFRLDLSATGII
jgi:hypothetical protein